jgi:protein TonB
VKADRPGFAMPPENGPHATPPSAAGRPWRALTLSLSVHAFVVAALFFFQWPGRVIEEPAPQTVRLVLGDGRSGAQGGGQSSRSGGGGTGEAGSPAAAGDPGVATAAAPAEPPEPRPTGSSVGTPAEPSRPPAETTDAAPDAAQPPAAATRADLREPPPLPTPRPYRPHPPSPTPPPPPPSPSLSQPAPPDILPPARNEPADAAPGPPIDLLAPRVANGSTGQGGAPGEGGGGRGSSGGGRAVLGDGARENPGDDYLDRLLRHLARYKNYPREARDRKQEGTAVVTFTIGRDGSVSGAAIERSAGAAALDEAALDLLRAADPVPALPETFTGRSATVSLPITYSLSVLNRLF